MYLPALNYTFLASGVFMMSASAYVIYKVYKGSKSQFAYCLVAFTFLDGAQNFASLFIAVFRHPIVDYKAFDLVENPKNLLLCPQNRFLFATGLAGR